MSSGDLEQRLSRISTQWTVFLRAHQSDAAENADLGRIVERYTAAVFRYLLGAVRDANVAEELAQEFALRFLRGDFRRADPKRGRLRHYLKTVLVNLVNDYHRAQQASPKTLPAHAAERRSDADEEQDFTAKWREELLERTWRALAEANPTYHATLLLRVDNPEATSAELADLLGARLARDINAALVRKTIERAQRKFAELLLDEVRQSMDLPSGDDIREELEELNLLRYCRSALPETSNPT